MSLLIDFRRRRASKTTSPGARPRRRPKVRAGPCLEAAFDAERERPAVEFALQHVRLRALVERVRRVHEVRPFRDQFKAAAQRMVSQRDF